jgi:4-hydroxybenzoate polyprenyltransferase/phosphoserine phosphatase
MSELSAADVPLYVDLDGTLLRGDLLWEGFAGALRAAPLAAVAALGALASGRAHLKRRIAQTSALDMGLLPWRTEFTHWLADQARLGRRIVLATAADRTVAQQVADHFGFFSAVLASEPGRNLKGPSKLAAIQAEVGEGPFDYCGNGPEDLPIFAAARAAIVVGGDTSVLRRARRMARVEQVFGDEKAPRHAWLHALRPHQWLKNLLVGIPLLTSFRFGDPVAAMTVLGAFVAFCLAASAGYLINDLLDMQSDRRHPRKRRRPLASGVLAPARAVAMAAGLLAGALALSVALRPVLLAWIALYLMLTVLYSLQLKRQALVDVATLALLYTVRILAGGAAAAVPVSFWLLAFSLFLFFSLALVKRCAELVAGRDRAESTAHGRGYTVADLPVLLALGVATSVAAVLVFALFARAPEVVVRYQDPRWLWLTLGGLMMWLARIWLLTQRGRMHDDPLVYSISDPVSRWLIALMVLGFAAAAWLPV